MIGAAIFIVNLILLVGVLILAKKRSGGTGGKREQGLARLEEVVRSAELTNGGFFRSLELVQKNLESLLARAENAERRLRVLMLQPNGDKKDQYAAAALLLNDGQQPERIASMLNLPLPQVQTVQNLRQISSGNKKNPARKKAEVETAVEEPLWQKKTAAPREKIAARPAPPAPPAPSVKKNEPPARPASHRSSRHARVIA